ncbi:unnamed protein product [Peniophora sp. CBMAI 1063]|nr:unnamed protein product [Peniophora sp. CBMAI 1063]
MQVKVDPSLSVTKRSDIYPAIDPASAFANKTFAGKTVLITGASRGIGQSTAVFFAKAGAAVALTARSSLDETVALIEKEAPGAQVATFTADVKDVQRADEVVAQVVEQFGDLHVLVANAGAATPLGQLMGDIDPKVWWNVFETNIYGVYSYVRPSLKHLAKTSGHVLIVTSAAAHMRLATTSDYIMSKQSLIRMAELITLEYPSIKAMTYHPGGVWTAMSAASGLSQDFMQDKVELAAGTALALASGRFDWLSSRYVDATWDLEEVEKLKDAILGKDALVCKLALP